MDTPDEIARDLWYAELVEKISTDAIDQFTFDRLRSYYLSNSSVAANVISVFREAEAISVASPSAAVVLFITSVELCLKVALLKPLVYGLIHNESVAELVSDLSIKQNGLDRFRPFLARILAEYGGIDFHAFTIEGHSKTLWEELATIQTARNALVHQGQLASPELAKLAKEVATMFIGTYLVSVLSNLGLKLVKGGNIENS
ncbi:hypothetical protein [Ideonella sp.]|uniref:hypothetical protein n=1 Tax=Ideonella sp. TaxID=1929293 RepID=UPI003BB6EA71